MQEPEALATRTSTSASVLSTKAPGSTPSFCGWSCCKRSHCTKLHSARHLKCAGDGAKIHKGTRSSCELATGSSHSRGVYIIYHVHTSIIQHVLSCVYTVLLMFSVIYKLYCMQPFTDSFMERPASLGSLADSSGAARGPRRRGPGGISRGPLAKKPLRRAPAADGRPRTRPRRSPPSLPRPCARGPRSARAAWRQQTQRTQPFY